MTEKLDYLVSDAGEKIAVMVPIKTYQKLMDDLHDLSIVAERKDEPNVPFAEIKKRLKIDDIL